MCADYGSEAGGPSGLRQEMRLQCSRVNPSRRVESQRNFQNFQIVSKTSCDAMLAAKVPSVMSHIKPSPAQPKRCTDPGMLRQSSLQ